MKDVGVELFVCCHTLCVGILGPDHVGPFSCLASSMGPVGTLPFVFDLVT